MNTAWKRLALCATMAATVAFSGCRPPASEAAVQEAAYRARTGDTVWILLNHVKADQRESFERFVEQILTPALQQAAAGDPIWTNILAHNRVLYPTRQNADGTYTYVYMLEHYIPGDYGYRRLLSAVYTPEEVAEYLRIPAQALDRPQETHLLVQTRPW